jgi:Cytochrome c554 and c-prime
MIDRDALRAFSRIVLRAATFAFAAQLHAAQAAHPMPDHSADMSVGTVNCASSLCHGSITPWKDSAVLQDEYTTWSRLDKHAKAFNVLSNDRSRKIARNLSLPKPANESALCLDCHANNVAVEHRGDRFNLQDGVTCEACHGPAGRWIKTHVEPHPDHQRNLDNGLYDTSNAVDRARLCLSCHFGNADKLVTHRLMGAGHPRLSFELDTFSSIEPSHARPEKLQDGVKLWAVGQALAVSASMSILTDPRRGHDGLFPELVLFDCHACHHPMSEARWKPRTTFGASLGPGIARLNDSSLLMMRVIARQIDPALGARVTEQAERLQAAAAGKGDVNVEAVGTRVLAEDVARRIDASPLDAASLRGIALGLVDEGLAGNYGDYAGAEQAAMAIGSVVQFMNRRGQLRDAHAVNEGLTRLLAELADDERYRPAVFQQRLQTLRGLIASP